MPRLAARRQLAAHPGTGRDRLVELSTDDSWRARMDVASNPACWAALLETLARDAHPRVRLAAARRAELAGATLASLATDGAVTVRRVVAERVDTPKHALHELSGDPDAEVRRRVAGNATAGPGALARLAVDPDQAIRTGTAANPRTPGPVLAQLILHDDPVGLAAAGNPATPPDVLETVARRRTNDRAWARVLAGNPSLPGPALSRLVRRSWWDVQIAPAANPTLPDRSALGLMGSNWRSVRAAVARHATHPETLRRAAADTAPMVQLGLAGNPACPPELLRTIGRWDRLGLRQISGWALGKALSNPNLPADLVARMAGADGLPPWTLRAIANHPACPPERRDGLLTWLALGGAGPGDPTFDPDNPTVNPDGAGEPLHAFLARHVDRVSPRGFDSPLWSVRHAAFNRATWVPTAAGFQLARDPEPAVRRRAASFFLGPETLRELSGGVDQWTATVAASTLAQAPAQSPTSKRTLLARVMIGAVAGLAAIGTAIGAGSDNSGHASGRELPGPPSAAPVVVSIPGGGSVAFTSATTAGTTTTEVTITAAATMVFRNRVAVVDLAGQARTCRNATETVVLAHTSLTATCDTNGLETALDTVRVDLKVGGIDIALERGLAALSKGRRP